MKKKEKSDCWCNEATWQCKLIRQIVSQLVPDEEKRTQLQKLKMLTVITYLHI